MTYVKCLNINEKYKQKEINKYLKQIKRQKIKIINHIFITNMYANIGIN